ncbi:MAG: hypothetical protein COB07_07975 [Sulfurovum sp.]|nr:MAG: hypothetical protein COB07_07975 [Sulfurovum sp.]
MKKITTLSLVAALAVSSAFAGGDIVPVEEVVVEAAPESALEISANLAITSNYIFRGITQTANSPAVQGGIDLGYKGFYLGTWGSNVDFGGWTNNNLEADFYAGYAGEIAGFGYDLGYIYYAYPNESNLLNLDEAYVGLSYDWDSFGINGKYSFALNTENDTPDYWEVGASAKLPWEMTLAAAYGDYDSIGSNYIVSLAKTFGKFEIKVAYTDFSSDDRLSLNDEDHIVGTISTSF